MANAKILQLYADDKKTEVAYPYVHKDGIVDDQGNNPIEELSSDLVNLSGDVGNKTSLNTDNKSSLVSAINEVNNHFVAPVGDAVNTWLNAHPEATTTVQDASLTSAKFTNDLKLHTLKDYITPQMFGAKGDGTTDDSTSIQSAIDYANTNGLGVFFPNGSYKTTTTIIVKCDLKMDGAIVPSENVMQGITISNLTKKRIELNVTSSAYINGAIGVNVIDCTSCIFDVKFIRGFQKGLQVTGYSDGCCYNTFNMQDILNCANSLVLYAYNNGWVNENLFINGRYRKSSDFGRDCIGISLISENTHPINCNTFIKPSLETLTSCVYLNFARRNTFYSVRAEHSTRFEDSATTNSEKNIFYIPFESEGNDYYCTSGIIVNFDTVALTSNNRVADIAFGKSNSVTYQNGSNTRTLIPKLNTYAYSSDAYNNYGNNFTVADDYTEIPNKVILGSKIKLNSANKIVHMACVFKETPTYRTFIKLYDANGTEITDSKPIVLQGRGTFNYSTTVKGFYSGNDISSAKETYTYLMPENVASAFIGIRTLAVSKITKFVIDSVDISDESMTDVPMATPSIPISVGYSGQVVFNANPTADSVGWIYNGTSWIAF